MPESTRKLVVGLCALTVLWAAFGRRISRAAIACSRAWAARSCGQLAICRARPPISTNGPESLSGIGTGRRSTIDTVTCVPTLTRTR